MQGIKHVSQQGGTTLHSRFALSTQVSEYNYLLRTSCEKKLSWKKIQLLLFCDFSPELEQRCLYPSVRWAHHLPAPLCDLICRKSQLNQRLLLCSPGSIMEQDVIWAIAILGYLQARLSLYKGAGCCRAGYHWQASAQITQTKARDVHKIG